MKNEMVSIIVPVYRIKERDLRACIESILKQTYSELEVLLIDDGSPDACGTICDEYAGKDERVRVIHQPNGGVSRARNRGLELAKGEYLTFVDADDVLSKTAMEKAVDALNAHHVDCVIFGWVEEKQGKENREVHRVTKTARTVPGVEASRVIAQDNLKYGGGYPWNKVWKMSAVGNENKKIQFDTGLYAYEDKLWILEVLKNVERVALLPDILYYYKYNSTGLSKDSGMWEYRVLNTFDAYKKIVDCLSYDKKSQNGGKVFVTNFMMEVLWPAWVYRRFNMGYFQRVKQKFYDQRDNIRLKYARGVRNSIKYVLLMCIFEFY